MVIYDVTIIGAGIIGACIARELSRYQLKTIIIEKENDVANGTTKANSAIVHAGYDAKPGTLKARTNVQGNKMFEGLCKELGVPFKRIGSLVVAFNEEEINTLQQLLEQGVENGVPEMRILTKEEVLEKEPNLNSEILAALYAPTAAIVGPFELAIALAENAVENGVELLLNSPVTQISKNDGLYELCAGDKTIKSRYVINCGGLYADDINNMVNTPSFKIIPNRGQYLLFDKSIGDYVKTVVFQCPTKLGKGVLILPTVHGNLIMGPTSENVHDKAAVETTREGFDFIRAKIDKVTRSFPHQQVITSFSGLRAKVESNDFIIEESNESPGFINVAAIDSPGLTAAPAIGAMVADMIRRLTGELREKPGYVSTRRAPKSFMELDESEKAEIIKKDPRYGRIICRCENITEGEIVDIIKRYPGARSLDGVKRRARAGMGRCQGGFCGPRVMEIIARELSLAITDVVKDSSNSYILTGPTKSSSAKRADELIAASEDV